MQADQTYMQADQTCLRAVACREHIVASAIMEVLLLKCVCLDRRQRCDQLSVIAHLYIAHCQKGI